MSGAAARTGELNEKQENKCRKERNTRAILNELQKYRDERVNKNQRYTDDQELQE